MKEFRVKTIEVHTKVVTHKVFADTIQEAETKVRDTKNPIRSHTRIENQPTKVKVISVESIKDTGKY